MNYIQVTHRTLNTISFNVFFLLQESISVLGSDPDQQDKFNTWQIFNSRTNIQVKSRLIVNYNANMTVLWRECGGIDILIDSPANSKLR